MNLNDTRLNESEVVSLFPAPLFWGRRTLVFGDSSGKLYFYRRPLRVLRLLYVPVLALVFCLAAFCAWATLRSFGLHPTSRQLFYLASPIFLPAFFVWARLQSDGEGQVAELASRSVYFDAAQGGLFAFDGQKLAPASSCTLRRAGEALYLEVPGRSFCVQDGDAEQADELAVRLTSAGCRLV